MKSLERSCVRFGWLIRASTAALTLTLTLILGINPVRAESLSVGSTSTLPTQTDVDRAVHLFDPQGVPILQIEGRGKQYHPAWIAIYALAYGGQEVYDTKLANLKDKWKFAACINWLEKNLKQQASGLWVWEYGFDNTYNDISIKAPWSSAFAQAVGIQAFLAAFKQSGNDKYLALANKAAQSLFTPLAKGGFLFQTGSDIWFEEIPKPIDNPSHILNGHMRVLLALKELADASGDAAIASWLKRGTDTLYRWLPRYDTGYWLRYDLNPRKKDLLFRFANPYGFTNHSLAVDRITLRDPVSKQEIVLDIGAKGDAEGATRIAGSHWGQIEQLSGRTVRRLIPAELESKPDEMAAPHSYFYLTLPGEWKDNLRDQWYEMDIEYYDDAEANITVQQRAVSPGPTFRDTRDGDLHLTGAGQWRKWIVPLRPTDLGYWVGSTYADKHAKYLNQLAKQFWKLRPWANVATGYLNRESLNLLAYKVVQPAQESLPQQTPMVLFSLDKTTGLLRQHAATPDTELVNGLPAVTFDATKGKVLKSRVGPGIVNPQGVAEQLLRGEQYWPKANREYYSSEFYPYGYRFDTNDVKRQPAYEWLSNPDNQITKEIAGLKFTTWPAQFRNVYNDIVTEPPWPSAFTQALIVKALFAEGVKINTAAAKELGRQGLRAFNVDVSDGGVSSIDSGGGVFFEEVPNNTHVLNAHILSINELSKIGIDFNEKGASKISSSGIEALREKLYKYDAGYWLRYDQNPKKELLFQIDWLDGEASPLIESINFFNPISVTSTAVTVGATNAFDGAARISGSEWNPQKTVDGHAVRGFSNGYKLRKEAVKGGARHNVFYVGILPGRDFGNYFDVPEHKLVIRYKDVAVGRFAVKIQPIHEGNFLSFVNLRGGILTMTGDQQWKEAVFSVRPQDMGWYKGPDYQAYEVEQLQHIAKLTGDWFFSQYVDRHGYFLEKQKAGKSAIIESVALFPRPSPKLIVKNQTPTYPGYGFANALDGDPNNDYVAGLEGEKESVVEVSIDTAVTPKELRIIWESEKNFAKSVKVFGFADKPENLIFMGEAQAMNLPITRIPLRGKMEIKNIRIVFSEFAGQPRLLLRLLEIK